MIESEGWKRGQLIIRKKANIEILTIQKCIKKLKLFFFKYAVRQKTIILWYSLGIGFKVFK